jgi:periplasmic divalent cation tolerance protein
VVPTVIVLSTFPADADAETVARALVDERLAACVTILGGVTSVYRWDDQIQRDQEQQFVIKTRADRVDALRERLQALHPYDVPEFLVVPVTGGSERYLGWVRDSTEIL